MLIQKKNGMQSPIMGRRGTENEIERKNEQKEECSHRAGIKELIQTHNSMQQFIVVLSMTILYLP